MEDSNNRNLWAPWRIEFIRSEKSGLCFLCGKDRDSSSSDEELIVARGKSAFVILNRYPYNSGHLLVAPYRHLAKLSSLNEAEMSEIFAFLARSEAVLDALMKPDGFNAGLNLGAAAGAGVKDHIHFHMVPRWSGDTNFMPVIADSRVVPEALLKTAELVKRAWKEFK